MSDAIRKIIEADLSGEFTWFTPWGVYDKNGRVTTCTPPDSHHWEGEGETCVCGGMVWKDEYVDE